MRQRGKESVVSSHWKMGKSINAHGSYCTNQWGRKSKDVGCIPPELGLDPESGCVGMNEHNRRTAEGHSCQQGRPVQWSAPTTKAVQKCHWESQFNSTDQELSLLSKNLSKKWRADV